MMQEQWKPISGFAGRYEVSNFGRVRSLNYRMRKGCVQILRPSQNSDGYTNVHLYALDGGKSYKVHRLVAQAFLPNPKRLPEVNHKNEIKNDNRATNLEWCSRDENMHFGSIGQKISDAQSKPVIGTDPTTEAEIYVFPSAESSRAYGFVPSEVSRCCRKARGREKHKGLCWKYAEQKRGEVVSK